MLAQIRCLLLTNLRVYDPQINFCKLFLKPRNFLRNFIDMQKLVAQKHTEKIVF